MHSSSPTTGKPTAMSHSTNPARTTQGAERTTKIERGDALNLGAAVAGARRLQRHVRRCAGSAAAGAAVVQGAWMVVHTRARTAARVHGPRLRSKRADDRPGGRQSHGR